MHDYVLKTGLVSAHFATIQQTVQTQVYSDEVTRDI